MQRRRDRTEVRQDFAAWSDAARSGLIEKSAPHVVCTLADGGYFHGLAALTNSLVQAGFEGNIVVGYRGGKPPWLGTLKVKNQALHVYEVTSVVHLHLVEFAGTWNLANLKAH